MMKRSENKTGNRIQEGEKNQTLRWKKTESIVDVLEEVEVLIDTRFFIEFHETKSAQFLKTVITTQGWIDMRLPRKRGEH